METRIRMIKHGDLCKNLREVRAAPHKLQKRKKAHGMINDLDNVDFSLKRPIFSSGSFVVCVRR